MFKLINLLIESINWLRIVIFPTFLGVLLGGCFYWFFQDNTGKIIWIISSIIGFVFGIIWASRIWIRQGTTNYMAKLNATPEFDKLHDDNDNK
jgi:hypothetical protein